MTEPARSSWTNLAAVGFFAGILTVILVYLILR
ncbi:MAG: hypothetical protein JWO25_2515 [Alphaproteobacteria bacterium]|nr:hypothetical protein [Alphaproteobacteria bacterium]MDB5719725.1 hypothetical protein [Alphaproteobacteria bacterium]